MNAEVEAVLESIKTNYGTVGVAVVGHSKVIEDLSDVPLERIDRNNSDNLDKAGGVSELDGAVHEHADSLQGMNYVSAGVVSRQSTPIGTEYDHEVEPVVSGRIVGLHADKYGAIDPQKGTDNERDRDYPTITWQNLKLNIRRSIADDRTFPDTKAPTSTYKDLFFDQWRDRSINFTDFYVLNFEIRFVGFETLP